MSEASAELIPDGSTAKAHTDPEPVRLVADLRARVEQALRDLPVGRHPEELYAPVRYVLEGGGKRLRPVLLILSARIFGADVARAMPAALAVEVFHNFTLVHDDIMDHAISRRGRATVHERWDEGTAILCGDLLMAMAYDLLAQTDTPRLPEVLRTFHRMVVRLCEGQALDKAFETRDDLSVADYLDMIDRKTGALLEAVLELGALVGNASEEEREVLRSVGRNVGRAFQIQDDLLDLTAEHSGWGKVIGGDLMEGKKTFLLLRALEQAQGAERAWFQRIIEVGGLAEGEVPEARERMARLGVLDEAREAVALHSAAALERLGRLPASPAREALHALIERMQARVH